MESVSSHGSDRIDTESDSTDNEDEKQESGDEDDICMVVDKEMMYTPDTYSNHGTNDYNMIGRQEKLDKVLNSETKLPPSLMIEMELLTIMKKQKLSINCFPIIVEWGKKIQQKKGV